MNLYYKLTTKQTDAMPRTFYAADLSPLPHCTSRSQQSAGNLSVKKTNESRKSHVGEAEVGGQQTCNKV